jgi:hypothetical protein
MGDRESSEQAPKLEVLQTVRCLGCGAVYSKPAAGGTVTETQAARTAATSAG